MLWLLWLGFFAAIEGDALVRKDYASTLTAHIRKWAAMEGKPAGWRARRAMLVAFLAWLVAHLVLPAGSF